MKKTFQGNRWALVGIAFLAVIAIGLSVFALQQGRGEPAETTEYTYTPEPETEPETGPEETPEPEPEPLPEPVSVAAPQRFIELGEAGHIVRGVIGTCSDPSGWAEVSFDGGITWEASATESIGATQLLNASIDDVSFVEMIVRDEFCDPTLIRSYVGGVSWQLRPGEAAGRWYFDPADASTINTPFGALGAPCEVVQLSVSGTANTAAVLCKDARVAVSADGGESWTNGVAVPGATSISAQDSGTTVATVGVGECSGVQLQQVIDSVVSSQGSCLDVSAAAGELVVAASTDEVVVWADDYLAHSFDAGGSWQ